MDCWPIRLHSGRRKLESGWRSAGHRCRCPGCCGDNDDARAPASPADCSALGGWCDGWRTSSSECAHTILPPSQRRGLGGSGLPYRSAGPSPPGDKDRPDYCSASRVTVRADDCRVADRSRRRSVIRKGRDCHSELWQLPSIDATLNRHALFRPFTLCVRLSLSRCGYVS
jgi:hypothetical protein